MNPRLVTDLGAWLRIGSHEHTGATIPSEPMISARQVTTKTGQSVWDSWNTANSLETWNDTITHINMVLAGAFLYFFYCHPFKQKNTRKWNLGIIFPNPWLKQIHPNLFRLYQLLRSPVLCWVDPPATVPYCGLPTVRSLILECVPQGEKRIFWGVRNPGALEWLVRVILVGDEEWFLMAFFGL